MTLEPIYRIIDDPSYLQHPSYQMFWWIILAMIVVSILGYLDEKYFP